MTLYMAPPASQGLLEPDTQLFCRLDEPPRPDPETKPATTDDDRHAGLATMHQCTLVAWSCGQLTGERVRYVENPNKRREGGATVIRPGRMHMQIPFDICVHLGHHSPDRREAKCPTSRARTIFQ
jgi:hypothetical protein